MENMPENDKNWLVTIIIAAAVFVVLFSLVFIPLIKKNLILNKQIDEARLKLSKYTMMLGQKEIFENKFSPGRNAAYPQENSDLLVGAIAQIERMANAANIKINDIRPHPNLRSQGRVKEIAIELSTEGQMEGFMKFIYGLENSFMFLEINKIRLSSSKTDSTLLEGNFSLSQVISNN